MCSMHKEIEDKLTPPVSSSPVMETRWKRGVLSCSTLIEVAAGVWDESISAWGSWEALKCEANSGGNLKSIFGKWKNGVKPWHLKRKEYLEIIFHPFDTQSNHLTLIELVSSVASEKELEIRSDIALQQPNEAKPILSLCISTLRWLDDIQSWRN